jgi:hypothetical protein
MPVCEIDRCDEDRDNVWERVGDCVLVWERQRFDNSPVGGRECEYVKWKGQESVWKKEKLIKNV